MLMITIVVQEISDEGTHANGTGLHATPAKAGVKNKSG